MNRYFKITSLLLMAVLASVGSLRADDYDLYLVAMDDHATQTSLDLAHLRSLSFSQERVTTDDGGSYYANYMSVNKLDGTAVTYELNNYASLRFGIADPSAFERVISVGDEPAFAVIGRTLRVNTSGMAAVFTLDGRLALRRSMAAGEQLSLQQLPQGTYIINHGGQSAKIYVK